MISFRQFLSETYDLRPTSKHKQTGELTVGEYGSGHSSLPTYDDENHHFGFSDSSGRFMDRKQAMKHAINHDLIKPGFENDKELTSQMLKGYKPKNTMDWGF